jgi:gliding motility-associated-like protein
MMTMKKKRAGVIIFFILLNFFAFAQNPPTITPCGSSQDICLTGPIQDLCIQINVFPGLPAPISFFTINWNDGSALDTILGGPTPEDQIHTYDLAGFYGTCDASQEYFIVLRTYLTNGSELNNSFVLTFYNPPIADFDFDHSIVCLGAEVEINDASCPTQGLEQLTVNWGDGTPVNTESSHVYTAVGAYPVTLSVENPCGADTYTDTVDVISPAQADAIAIDGIIPSGSMPYIVCLGGGGVVTLDGCISLNESSYVWNVVSGNGYDWITPQNICMSEIAFSSPGMFTLELTVNNACNQPDDVQLTFQVLEADALQLQAQEDVCLSLDYSPSPLLSGAVYEINGVTILNQAFPVNLGLGQYTINATLSNECGIQVLRDTFYIIPPANIEILSPANDTTICSGTSIALFATSLDGTWTGGNITVTGDSTTFLSNESGSFLIIYQNGQGACEQRDSVLINVDGISAQMNDIETCTGESYVLLNGLPLGGVWSSQQCPLCIQQDTFWLNGLPFGQSTVQVDYSISNSNGCVGTTQAAIEILTPLAQFSFVSAPCANTALDVDYLNSSGSAFIWRIDGETMPGPPFPGLSIGQHTFELVAIAGECHDSFLQIIDVIAPPLSAAFSANVQQGCPPFAVVFTPLSDLTESAYYQWTFNRFPGDTLAIFNPLQPIVFDNLTDTITRFPVNFSISNECGEVSNEIIIEVLPLPTAHVGIDSVVSGCSPLGVILTNRASGNPLSCLWEFSDGFSLSSCQDTIHRTFIATDSITKYIVALTAANNCGTSTAYDTITVIPPGVSAYYNLSNYSICAFDSIRFEDASTPIPTSWLWNFGDGTVSDQPNPVHIYNMPNDTFRVRLTVSTGCGSDDIEHIVVTMPVPPVDFDLPPYGCQGQPVIGITNNSNSEAFYLWEYGNGKQDINIYEPIPVFSEGGSTVSIRLTVTDFTTQCSNSLEKAFYIRNKPEANFDLTIPADCPVLAGEVINLSANANAWIWKFDGQESSFSENTGYTFSEIGYHEIRLIASWDNICIDSTSLFVKVEECGVYVPNAFSPNGDGVNDFFTVYGTPNIEVVKSLKIFDRWGELIFEQKNFPANTEIRGWNGSFRGKPLNPGVFAWVAEIQYENEKIVLLKGDVTLVR